MEEHRRARLRSNMPGNEHKPMTRIFLFALIMSVFSAGQSLAQKGRPIDKKATTETKALFRNLKKLSKKHTLFGHQHATEYGRGWFNEPGRSDVRSVTGSHPPSNS